MIPANPDRSRWFCERAAGRFSALLFSLLLCIPARAQDHQGQRRSRENAASNRVAEPSDLAEENFDRVAASAMQIREVLIKDAGILVELKRWAAKEATDNGQIVEDASLTDDAIFDRLEHDVQFRSVATRLLQRYGYLLPNVNPESAIAKEQDLGLKERARRLVQIEAQEDTESLRPSAIPGEQTSRASCDQQQQNCDPHSSPRVSRGRPNLEQTPGAEPTSPSAPEQFKPRDGARTLRAGIDRERPDTKGFQNTDPSFSLASDPDRDPRPGPVDGFANSSRSYNSDNPSLRANRGEPDMATEIGTSSAAKFSDTRGKLMDSERDLGSVTMVHKRNPYADIPSLYDMYVQAASRDGAPDRFGAEIFRNGTREPNSIPMDLPVGSDYIVGPGDGLSIDLWGGVSQRMVRVVDREGRINLPEVGPLLVSGRTLGEVQRGVQQLLRTQFRDASADVSLSRLRTVRVYVVGEVAEPGAYDISSLSTPLNALFAAGGITQRGSLRSLKHFRGRQLIETVDAYDLLLRGVGSELKRLENGDSLLIPATGPQVTVSGMVRHPAVYELHGETTLADVLDLAGGILPAAALRHIEVQRLEAHEKRSMLSLALSSNDDADGVAKQLSAFKIQDGDQVHIFPIAPFNESAIYLQGHVARPGRYSYRDGMKLTDVIASYADLLPEPAGRYAEIVRLNAPDYRPSVESFDLTAALANPSNSPKLQPLDTIRIFSRYDFEPAPAVWIGGEVRAPGKYRTSGQVRLRDAIHLAGGVSPDASLNSAQLFRTQTDGTLKILSVNLGEALAGNPIDNLLLDPRDRILVHRNSAKVDPPTVFVKGEVAKPGRYPLTDNMHVEDLVRVAGGLKRSADSEIADLTRYAEGQTPQNAAKNMGIKLSAALVGNVTENIPLRDGDVLTIRQNAGWNDIGASVTVKGEIQHPGSYGIRPGEKLSSVLERAGGFGPQAYPYGAVLTRREVRDLEMKSHLELVQRVKAEQVILKALPETDADQKNLKMTAIAQTETVLTQLESTAPIGRVVVHIKPELNHWLDTVADVPVRDGDVLLIPKKADYVVVTGQVFNSTAISYRPGRSAKWYLGQSGGLTQLADKKAVFVIRADGSVLAAKNNSSDWFSGDPLNATLRPGDAIVVPEKAPRIGSRNWGTLFQAAQVASSLALAVAYIHP